MKLTTKPNTGCIYAVVALVVLALAILIGLLQRKPVVVYPAAHTMGNVRSTPITPVTPPMKKKGGK